MAYIVNKTDGTVVATVADGTIDTTSTSLTLLGKGFNNYGEIVAEDWVHLMEHFSNATAPSNELRGQLWHDTTTDKIKVNISNVQGNPEWVLIGSAFVSATEPTTGFGIGGFWFDTTTNTLLISTDGSTFTNVNASGVNTTQPTSPVEGALFYDTVTKELKVFNSALHEGGPGFDVVGPARHEAVEPTTNLLDGDLWWNSDTKQLFVWSGDTSTFRLIGPLEPEGLGGLGASGIVLVTNDGNPLVEIVVDGEIIGIWSRTKFTPSPAITGFPLLERGLTLTNVNGDSTEETLFAGTATTAQYADIAERFAADDQIVPGEVVSLGGEAEITITKEEKDSNVLGVISTDPAFLMNDAVGDNKTHPPVALTGRVPCYVIGPVKKGDRLVSSNTQGVATVISSDEVFENYTAIIGRALETNDNSDVKLVEILVGTK
ncbi:hypothetical protein LCGC14_1383380 [marine sediment metagenome]|uniref:Uncharacterized protein n=1 Tax=marine sediment metagenome TaxID=412755 RepID=A0A0F9N3L4_9ZZZZ